MRANLERRPRRLLLEARVACALTVVQLLLNATAHAQDLAGTAITYRPYIEVEGGYNSNPDSLVRRHASHFEKLESGLAIAARRPNELYELTFKVRGVRFDELDIVNRWDARVGIDTAFELGNGQQLKIGTSYLRDFFSFNRADVYKSYLDYTLKSDDFRLRLQGKSNVEINIERDEDGALPPSPDVFDTIRGRAFDYAKSEAQIAVLGFTRSWLQPFAIYNFANVDYFHQAADPVFDRNAVEHFAIAGVRVELGKPFRIDVGARINHRDFDDPQIRRFTSEFYDVNFIWTPVETFKLKGVIERVIKEPSTAFGLADDVRSYGLTAEWRAAEKLRLTLSGYYDRVLPIGDDFKFNKYSVVASSTYDWSKDVELFVSGLAKWVDDDVTGQSYTRFKIGTGVKMKFN